MSRHVYLCPLRWADLDAQGHVNNGSYLDYLQEARVDFLLSGPEATRPLLTTGVLVVSHQVEYVAPIAFSFDPVRVELWVESVGGSRFVIGYEVYAGDTLAARARTAAVPYDLATNALRRLTEAERAVFVAARERSEALRVLPAAEVAGRRSRYALRVRWSDLDSYGHVNNVAFYDYVQEARIALVARALGWTSDVFWVVVRQDLQYLRPIDFRAEAYEVETVVTHVGTRSFSLAAQIRDPRKGTTYATAQTVVVGRDPLTNAQRWALAGGSPEELS